VISPRAEVKELAKQVALEETLTIDCPFCKRVWEQQGRPLTWRPNKSFSLSRSSTGVLYHCFRASCGSSSGFLPDVTLEHIPKKEFQPREYSYDLVPLDESTSKLFTDKGFTNEELKDAGVRYNPERKTYAFDIRDVNGYTVGIVDRDFGRRVPKAITYWFNDVPKLHFRGNTGGPILIVEDIPSAIKGSRYIQTVALLSSHINLEQVKHLRTLTDTVYLALDDDATDKAVKLQKRWGFYFKVFTVLPLSKDIKDMDEQELKEFSERLQV